MLATVIRTIIRFRFVVLLLVALGCVLSVYAIFKSPLDAIPDISDPQIVVYVKWPRSPQLIEAEVTALLVRALVGSSNIQSIRGTTHMGYSFIYVILDKAAQRDRVQQLVLDRIGAIRPIFANCVCSMRARSNLHFRRYKVWRSWHR